jgi:hypothetical protein
MEIKIRVEKPPAQLLSALERVRSRYTNSVAIYHYFALGLEGADCGVFGDGDNAAYEWFVWRNSVLETSDVAYGSPEIALRDVLMRVYA